MGPATFVIAILGCADGGTACTPVATIPTEYTTQAQCTAATGAALLENSNFDYPTLMARCRIEDRKAASSDKDSLKLRRG